MAAQLTSQSAFFTALAVIVVPLLDLFKGKALMARSLGSVLLAIGGVALLQLGPSLLSSSVSVSQLWSTGDWWCLAQAVFFGIGYWRLEAASVRFSGHSPRIIAGQLSAISASAMIYWLFLDGGGIPTLSQLQMWFNDGFAWQAIVWTGLVTTALAHYIETVALRVVSASELTVIMTSISLWGSALAYFTLGEVMTPVAMVGGLSILAGCLLTATGDKDQANPNSSNPP